MHKKYPPLTPDEVIAILRANGFVTTGQRGSHPQYENGSLKVTVHMSFPEFSAELIKSMIRESWSRSCCVLLLDQSHDEENQYKNRKRHRSP
ncbi:MAG: type II toxin-antitoxin system HicA family toxin [Bacteroidota bacterium]|nr:type II toxin-antitoxin system HicA family toxin [Bacteroidota bacterium]MDP4233595.1 type II toxin-antitoxin system HicA family toxin [Bacteroidota bacterium]MDP4244088.1 type II toxin-antitoxin system HicA family toxin [Bacteroidota bacterium]MDP4288523.1 type II toxin-antitoxin system HicA family toxin [Bacteroidota bacterium]